MRINIKYTENKPLGRLCKMCNPLFYEFRVNVFKLFFCTANTHKPQTPMARVDPDQRSRRRGAIRARHNTVKTIVHTVNREKRSVSAPLVPLWGLGTK
jgi:hypothetical protein